MANIPTSEPINLDLQGQLEQPIRCPCCADPVTLDQLQKREALLLWGFDCGVIAFHRQHLVKGSIMLTGRTGLQLDQAIVDREAAATPPLDTPPGSR